MAPGVLYLAILASGLTVWLAAGHRVAALQRVTARSESRLARGSVRLAYMACGAAPLTTLALVYAELVSLWVMMCFVVLPAYTLMLLMGPFFPDIGRRALIGFTAGIVAVLFYDVVRLALAWRLGALDPIPHIGELLVGEDADWFVGYLWRTFGNGAGLGVVFSMLPRVLLNPGGALLYGSVVNFGMLSVLWAFPTAQEHLFKLNEATILNGLIGHWAYGLVLGTLVMLALRRPWGWEGRHGRGKHGRRPRL